MQKPVGAASVMPDPRDMLRRSAMPRPHRGQLQRKASSRAMFNRKHRIRIPEARNDGILLSVSSSGEGRMPSLLALYGAVNRTEPLSFGEVVTVSGGTGVVGNRKNPKPCVTSVAAVTSRTMSP